MRQGERVGVKRHSKEGMEQTLKSWSVWAKKVEHVVFQKKQYVIALLSRNMLASEACIDFRFRFA